MYRDITKVPIKTGLLFVINVLLFWSMNPDVISAKNIYVKPRHISRYYSFRPFYIFRCIFPRVFCFWNIVRILQSIAKLQIFNFHNLFKQSDYFWKIETNSLFMTKNEFTNSRILQFTNLKCCKRSFKMKKWGLNHF